jgi:hypothetical protein
MLLKVLTVENQTRQAVMRANKIFPSGVRCRFVFDVESRKFMEIKACAALKILEVEDYTLEDTVLKIDETQSTVVPPVVVTKEEEPEESFLVEDEPVPEVIEETEIVVIEEPSVPEPVVDVTPVVLSPDEPVPDVTELEVAEVVEEDIKQGVSCPYCNFAAAKPMGTYHHVRLKHPEKYAEYKLRIKKS